MINNANVNNIETANAVSTETVQPAGNVFNNVDIYNAGRVAAYIFDTSFTSPLQILYNGALSIFKKGKNTIEIGSINSLFNKNKKDSLVLSGVTSILALTEVAAAFPCAESATHIYLDKQISHIAYSDKIVPVQG